jgi:protein involved in polysaccharide export with SLBB domain
MLKVALQKIEETALSARSKTFEEANLRSREAELLMRFVERAKQVKPKGLVVLANDQRNDTLLEDGDILVIPERTSLVMVHGEVVFPNAVSWSMGKEVEDYIGQAGGFSQSADTSKLVVIHQNGETLLANSSTSLEAGDEVMVLPKIETKNIEVAKALTQILYQIAFTAKIAFGL